MKTKTLLAATAFSVASLASPSAAQNPEPSTVNIFTADFCTSASMPISSRIDLVSKEPIAEIDRKALSEMLKRNSGEIAGLFKKMAENSGNSTYLTSLGQQLVGIISANFKDAKLSTHFEAETQVTVSRIKGAICREVPVMIGAKTGDLDLKAL